MSEKVAVLKEHVLASITWCGNDERKGIIHSRRHFAASPVFKGLDNFHAGIAYHAKLPLGFAVQPDRLVGALARDRQQQGDERRGKCFMKKASGSRVQDAFLFGMQMHYLLIMNLRMMV